MRHDTVVYECDWCGMRASAEPWPGGDLGAPKDWRVLDSFDFQDEVCPSCAITAKAALNDCKAERKKLLRVLSTPASHGDKHECG